MVKISASVLAADMGNLENAIKSVDPFIDEYHVDVMDGHFVPNLSGSPDLVKYLKKVSDKPVDTHLMVSNPLDLVDMFVDAGTDMFTFHIEAAKINLYNVIDNIKVKNVKVGIAYNPDSSVPHFYPVDRILVMSVYPGFSGQKFIKKSVKKIEYLRGKIDEKNLNCEVAVDGGINSKTYYSPLKAGVDVLVSSSCIFDDKCRKQLLNGVKP